MFFGACIVIVGLSGCDAVRIPIASSPSPSKTAAPNPVERQIITAINALRSSHHLGALAVHPNLEDKARLWSAWMSGGNCGPSGNGPTICHSDLTSGITAQWTMLEENVGAASPKTDVAGLISGFAHSAEHAANMLNTKIRYVGVGVAYSGNTLFVAEEFMAT
jgi:uncharacterized protein YkwD